MTFKTDGFNTNIEQFICGNPKNLYFTIHGQNSGMDATLVNLVQL